MFYRDPETGETVLQEKPEEKTRKSAWGEFYKKAIKLYGTVEITRKQAKDSKLIYYKGKVCPQGHDGFRYTANSNCVGCNRDNMMALNNGIEGGAKGLKNLRSEHKSRSELLYLMELSEINDEYSHLK